VLPTAAHKRSIFEEISTVISKRIKNKNPSTVKFQAVRNLLHEKTIFRDTTRRIPTRTLVEYVNTRYNKTHEINTISTKQTNK